jgi:monomeric sarcosine oxidase
MEAVESVDVAVVGLGLAGSAAAWAVSRRGHRVAAFEAYQPGHHRGSSHGHARIFRHAYLDDLYVELAVRAGRLWDRLAAEAGEPLLVRTGGIDHGPTREPVRMAGLLREHGIAAELLEAGEAARRWPGLRFDGPVVYDPRAGVLDPEAAMAAATRLAAAAGARVAYDTTVRGLEPDGTGVRIRTDAGTWHARTVVVAAGGWTAPLLTGLVPLPPLTVTQQQVFFFAPREPGAWPTLVHDDAAAMMYGLPEGSLIKIGEHEPGTKTAADTRDFVVDPAARDRAVSYVRRWLPGLDPEPRSEVTCLYTSTADEDFILDRSGPFVICSACSGHGAKFTPLIGELVADLVDGEPAIPRFALPNDAAQVRR